MYKEYYSPWQPCWQSTLHRIRRIYSVANLLKITELIVVGRAETPTQDGGGSKEDGEWENF